MWPLRSIFFFVAFWAACLASLSNPIWGLANYIFVYQADPGETWWGRPLVSLGMRFSLLAAAFTLLGLVFGRKRVPKVSPLFSPWELGVLALIGIAALNCFIGPVYSHHTRFAFEKLWKMMVFVLVLTRLASNRSNLRLVLWTLVIGSLYLGYDAYTAPADSFFQGRLNQVGGPDFSTTSGLAVHLSAMLPIIGVAFLTARKWKWKALALLSGAFTVNAIVLCRTRSAFVGLIVGATVALMAAPRARRFRIHILLIAAAAASFALTDSHFWDRMVTLTDKTGLQEDPATVSRMDIWKASWEILADYPQGIGVGNFTSVIGLYNPTYRSRASHNTVLVCFVELGVCGGVLLLAMAATSLRYIHRAARLAHLSANPLETRLMAYGMLISLVTYFVSGLGTERLYAESFWWVLALPLPLWRMVQREANAAVETLEPEPGFVFPYETGEHY